MTTTSAIKHLLLLKSYSVLSLKKLTEYKFNIIMNTLAYAVLIIAWVYFWSFLIGNIKEIAQWKYPMLVLLVGFLNLTFAFWQTIYFTAGFGDKIIAGGIDLYLVRPINPLFAMVMSEIQFFSLIPALIGIGLIVYTTITYFSFSILNFLIALLICLIAGLLLGIFFSIINTLAFWFGRISAFRQIFRCFQTIQQYPLDIFSITMQGVLIFFTPLYFFGTAQVKVILSADVLAVLKYLGFEMALFAFWLMVLTILWKKGVRRYESFGG